MPIPENAVKELLSRGFLRLVAGQAGFVPCTDELDFGVDVSLRHVDYIQEPGRIRHRASGFMIDVQLKATCEREVILAEGHLKYDLSATTFNDLVRRASVQHTIPLILGLFVLPDDPSQWLSLAESELTLRRCVFIWRPAPSEEATASTSTHRISIPLGNRLEVATFERIRQEYLS
jgi:hypothetical protein